jgi:hypothetical protein
LICESGFAGAVARFSYAGKTWFATMVLVGLRSPCAGLSILLMSAALGAGPALAVPAFAVQTSQPCASCHVGAFGPQLKPFGRDFKLHGYVGNDGKDHGLPLALTARTSFTHTAEPQPDLAPSFRPNDNAIIDVVSMYYAGRIAPQIGGFIEATFDGVADRPHLDNVDIRRAGEGQLFGHDMVWGLTANNGPTVSDPWNSTPVWGFPYNRSSLAPTPMAATLVDGRLAQRVVGAGAYMLWNDLLYSEVDIYKGLDAGILKTIGQDDGNQTTNPVPYGRLALIKDWGSHHAEVGAYALTGTVLPGGNQTFGFNNRVIDTAIDANYQFICDPAKVASDMLSAHATYIHEDGNIVGSQAQPLFGTLRHSLDTMRFDVSYSLAATVTPSVQYFRTTGTADASYWSTPTGSPNSDGIVFEVAYVPWGKPDSPFPNMNLRLAAQYISYFTFDGTSVNARNNNNLYLSLWTAVKF